MQKKIRIGTRDSQLAMWQALQVQSLLNDNNIETEIIEIKSDGDIDLVTPLYALGVQGVFTKTLDAALLSNRIDIAVHSMKDVPTQLAQGITQAAVLKRASHKDMLVFNEQNKISVEEFGTTNLTIATSSVRRKAMWLHKYPHHNIENIRGNVNTRLRKVAESNWAGAIFAAAGLERLNLKPSSAIELDWMLPAPAQGAIMVVCRENETELLQTLSCLNDNNTAICTKIERDFLKTLMGGCSTPISALAEIKNNDIVFEGNISSLDGSELISISKIISIEQHENAGVVFANELIAKGAHIIVEQIKNGR